VSVPGLSSATVTWSGRITGFTPAGRTKITSMSTSSLPVTVTPFAVGVIDLPRRNSRQNVGTDLPSSVSASTK
jgi:hypothetical protein